MNCVEANQIDLVDYLYSHGYQPQKIRNNDYWYLSPFRDEKEPSFKVNRQKNVWYDHGLGEGGNLVDFVAKYFHCTVSEGLQKISSFHPQKNILNHPQNMSFQRHKNGVLDRSNDTFETSIKIVAAKQPIGDPFLCRYLKKRRINKDVANEYCHEVSYELNNRIYKAIGSKNRAKGYELRNEYFKGSSSPKYVSYFNNRNANSITVFEGFFDFLSYQTMQQNQQQILTNFLVLNSLSFFERSLLLMEKHEKIHLYLDYDEAGRK